MKFILSFLIVSTILSADTCYKLSLGNAALTPATLCNQNNALSPTTPVKCTSPSLEVSTQPTIKCNVPTPSPTPVVSKCNPAPIECPKPTAPVIENNPSTQCGPGTNPHVPNSATPEPSSYALLGAGLVTAGIARYRKTKSSENI